MKEDKARNYLHSKLTDTVSSDMLAYQRHDDSQTDEGHEGLRRRHPLTHFQVGTSHNCYKESYVLQISLLALPKVVTRGLLQQEY